MSGTTAETIATIVAFIGFGGLITLAGFIWKLADRLRALESEASAARAIGTSASAVATATQREVSEFKVEVARHFATNETVEKSEARVIEAITRLGDRLDRFFEERAARRSPTRNP